MSKTIGFSHKDDYGFWKSLAWARNNPFRRSQYQIVHAVSMVNGFGTWKSGAQINTLIFDDLWPNVYLQLDESWSQTDGVSGTSRTVWTDNWDVKTIITNTGSPYVVATVTSTTLTPTVLVSNYNTGSGYTGVYTATLSNQFDAATSWAAKASAAQTLLGLYTPPAFGQPPATNTPWIQPYTGGLPCISAVYLVPISVSPFYQEFYFPQMMCAATYGYPVRSSFGGIELWPVAASIIDEPSPYSSSWVPPSNFGAGAGGCMVTGSTWLTDGRAIKSRQGSTRIGNPEGGYYNEALGLGDQVQETDATHRKVYLQEITISGGSFVFGTPVAAPLYGQPLKSKITYAPGDVGSNLTAASSSASFGILGFRSAST